MTTISEHKENLARELTKLDSANQLKFAAWCCFALTGARSVFDFLSRYSDLSAPDIHARIIKKLDRIWEGSESGCDCLDFKIQEWNVGEISMSEDSDAQGASDLLAALSFLYEWMRSHYMIDLANCAEQVINRIDYLEGFGLLPDDVKNPVDSEIRAQMEFIVDLGSGEVRDSGRVKYHEWLLSLGAP
ncbi:hypothetical protein [Burkholderia sp. RS02]|uniref:hypothetical protein n=1 Tax=unclassified Burkholderia TaxID=2613784 RepID=UPI0032187A61